MNNTERLVLAALHEQNPALEKTLAANGTLEAFVQNRADELSTYSVSLTQQQRIKEKWDDLGPLECAAKMKMAHALNQEIARADLLEFPQDETSPSSQDETTPSAPTI